MQSEEETTLQEKAATSASIRRLGIISLILGVVGAAFYWWTPTGIVISVTGLVFGVVGWTYAPRKTLAYGLVIGGVLLCIAALALDSTIAGLGLETVRFTALR